MKKHIKLFSMILVAIIGASNVAQADGAVSATTPSSTVTPTPIATSTPTPTATSTPAATPSPTVSGVKATPTPTPDPLYMELLTKNDIKDNLILKENQVCKAIKDQEDANKAKTNTIIEKSKSYSTAYNKIIDDIKLLLNPVKDKEALYYKGLVNSSDMSAENKEASLSESQISSLNLAIKAMRESMKYISLESVEYQKKLVAVQKNIDGINQSIEELNKQIVADKTSKDNEWNNFCAAMLKGDLKAANSSFDNLLKLKEHIIENYNGILNYKKEIEQQLASV